MTVRPVHVPAIRFEATMVLAAIRYCVPRFSRLLRVTLPATCTKRFVRLQRHPTSLDYPVLSRLTTSLGQLGPCLPHRTRPIVCIPHSTSPCLQNRTPQLRQPALLSPIPFLAPTTFFIDLLTPPILLRPLLVRQSLAQEVLCESIAVLHPPANRFAPFVQMLRLRLLFPSCHTPAAITVGKTWVVRDEVKLNSRLDASATTPNYSTHRSLSAITLKYSIRLFCLRRR